ncbi:hypothetical protein HAX54_044573, partial [Datura stramonium]|nr:hypothetical protein [Datura stramonium]
MKGKPRNKGHNAMTIPCKEVRDTRKNLRREFGNFLLLGNQRRRSKQVKIRGKVVNFTPALLNKLPGTLNVDSQWMRDLLLWPLYREICHTLSGSRRLVIIGVIMRDILRRERARKGQRFSFRGLLNRFLRARQVVEEEVNYRLQHDLKGLDSLVWDANASAEDRRSDRGAAATGNIDYSLSEHSRALYRVGLGFEEPFNDDDPTDDEKAHIDSNLEYDADEGEDFEMGEATYAPKTMR